jgi:CRP-like cAMP-binding protein
VVRTTGQVKARQTLFHEGLPASTVWLLVKGHVKLSITGPRGTTRVVDLVSGDRTPGAVLDPLGLGLGLHALTGETLSDAQVCGISRADAIRILSEEPGLAVRLLTELSQRMAGLVRSVGHDLVGESVSDLLAPSSMWANGMGCERERGSQYPSSSTVKSGRTSWGPLGKLWSAS